MQKGDESPANAQSPWQSLHVGVTRWLLASLIRLGFLGAVWESLLVHHTASERSGR